MNCNNKVINFKFKLFGMTENSILVIEDEKKVASFIRKGLEEHGYLVDVAYDGQAGLDKALENLYHAIILDLNLPKLNGYVVCKNIRARNSQIPIIILTALGTTENKITGFETGADDYLVKPFEFMELIARLKVVLKRTTAVTLQVSNILTVADLSLNLDNRTVKRGGVKIDLTAKEFSLLEYLIRNKERVIPRTELAEKVWEIKFNTGTNIIDVYVNFLRKKIDKNYHPKLIRTHIGAGYILTETRD
jgi:two-component system, OmpR family, copper resistance phosphate regulon response regulator CusR